MPNVGVVVILLYVMQTTSNRRTKMSEAEKNLKKWEQAQYEAMVKGDEVKVEWIARKIKEIEQEM